MTIAMSDAFCQIGFGFPWPLLSLCWRPELACCLERTYFLPNVGPGSHVLQQLRKEPAKKSGC